MIQEIELGIIFRSRNARPIDKANVQRLSESMSQVGLINAICVRPIIRYRGTTPFDAFEIVAGNHRYATALSLGWQTIRCDVVELDDLHAELAEIDENLIRANLTPAQEAQAVFRRKAIYEQLHPETRAGVAGALAANRAMGRDATENFSAAFATATAEATGKTDRSIRQAAARGAALGDDLKAIEGTSLDKGVELDVLAKLPADERKKLINCAAAGEIVSARKIRDIKDTDKAIAVVAAEEFANWLMERTDLSEMNTIISWLEGTKPREVIAAMRRIAA